MTSHHPDQAPESAGESDLPLDSPLDAPVASEPVLAPVAAEERMPALDVVRGFALLGIFLMNMEFFARPMQDISLPGIDPSAAGLDRIAEFVVFFFVQGKFWTLFSLLFGMGFAVMIERARRAGRPFVPAYLRRSLALLGIGLVHALLVWSGDILVTYAIAALLLLALRGVRHAWLHHLAGVAPPPMSPGRLATWGLASFGLLLVVALVFGALGSASTPQAPDAASAHEQAEWRAEMTQDREAAVLAYSTGTYTVVIVQRVIDTIEQVVALPEFLPFVLGVFLLGMAILRGGLLEHPHEHRDTLRAMRNVGLPVGFALMALSTWLGTGMGFSHFDLADAAQVISYLVAGLVLALAYGATVVLALDGPAGPWLQRWLAPAGRMALTNYLAQSIFGTLLFYGYGFGGWDRIGRAQGVALALAFYALQLVGSRAWLAQFRFGPA
ncbi:MAG: DUF418 domain-containing protein, partial [Arenimonas sp.]